MNTHNISRTRLCPLGIFFRFLVASGSRLHNAHCALEYATHITSSVRGNSREYTHAGFLGEVRLLDLAFGRVLMNEIRA